MTRARNGSKPPVEGASRFHKLAPASAPDAFEYVAEKLRLRGYTVIEQDYAISGTGGAYLMVDGWAIPPLAAGEAP